MEENENFLTKLKKRLYTIQKSKIVKAIAGLTLSLAIATSVGCGNTNNNNNNNNENNTNIEQPIKENKNRSSILNKVLTDPTYTNAVIQGKADQEANGAYSASSNRIFQDVPYGFLEAEGYNIQDVKNKNLSCGTDLYCIDNNLYIELMVENKGSKDFYGEYLLKYTLTNQEKKELNKLFSNKYFQAGQFIQELSYQKTPVVLSKQYLTVESHNYNREEMLKYIRTRNHVDVSGFEKGKGDLLHMILIDYDVDNEKMTYQVHLSQGSSTIGSATVATYITNPIGFIVTNINGKSVVNTKTDGYVAKEDRETFNSSKFTPTFYKTGDDYLYDLLDYDIINEL